MKKSNNPPYQRQISIWAFLLTFSLSLALFSCGDTQTAEGDNTDTEEATDSDDPSKMVFTPEAIQELKEKFEFNAETGWLSHKAWGKTLVKRTTLTVDINNNGYYYLSSVYFGKDALKHNQIEVIIGDSTYTSEAIDMESADFTTKKLEGKTYETVKYSKYRDNKIFDNIASSGDTPVKVKFVANKAHAEIDLSEKDKAAIIECYQASLLARAGQFY